MSRKKTGCRNCKRLERRIAELVERLEALEERLNETGANSSKPPSSLPQAKKPKTSKPKSSRNRGAQPGHDDQQRKLYSAEEVDRVIACRPKACGHCGSAFAKGDETQVRRVQRVEIPPIEPLVVEYQVHRVRCACGHETNGRLPTDVERSTFGPRVHAMVSLLSGAYRLSKREIAQLMNDGFGIEMSVGSVCNLEHSMSAALAGPVREARSHIRNAPVVHMDETGWREAKRKAWLWTALSGDVVTFSIRRGRGREVVNEILGHDFAGILNSDRWAPYAVVPAKRRQLCWAHLKRNFQKLVDRGGASVRIGNALLTCTRELFRRFDRVRDGTMKRSTFQSHARRISHDIFATLLIGAGCRTSKTANFCSNLLELDDALWTFTRRDYVDPTNNAAERAIRKPVLWRKGSFGTDSENGSRFVERILSAVATLRAQDRNVLDYLVDAATAHRIGQPAPSIVPSP